MGRCVSESMCFFRLRVDRARLDLHKLGQLGFDFDQFFSRRFEEAGRSGGRTGSAPTLWKAVGSPNWLVGFVGFDLALLLTAVERDPKQRVLQCLYWLGLIWPRHSAYLEFGVVRPFLPRRVLVPEAREVHFRSPAPKSQQWKRFLVPARISFSSAEEARTRQSGVEKDALEQDALEQDILEKVCSSKIHLEQIHALPLEYC